MNETKLIESNQISANQKESKIVRQMNKSWRMKQGNPIVVLKDKNDYDSPKKNSQLTNRNKRKLLR